MQLLAQYPVTSESITSYMGRPVAAMLSNGDIVCGIIDRCHDGHLFMKPLENVPAAAVTSMKQALKKSVDGKLRYMNKAKTKAFGFGGAYPYGYGYGNYGWGAGWWWIFPLFWLAALAAFPFWW